MGSNPASVGGLAGQNVSPSWIDAMAAAQALQQQQYLRSLVGSAGSPAASDNSSRASADPPQNGPSSPEEQESEAPVADQEADVGTPSNVGTLVEKEWLLQMFQKQQGQVSYIFVLSF